MDGGISCHSPGLPLKWKLKSELVKTWRTPSCLGSNHVVYDVAGFDQCDLHAAASVTKIPHKMGKILCLLLRFQFFLSYKVQKESFACAILLIPYLKAQKCELFVYPQGRCSVYYHSQALLFCTTKSSTLT